MNAGSLITSDLTPVILLYLLFNMKATDYSYLISIYTMIAIINLIMRTTYNDLTSLVNKQLMILFTYVEEKCQPLVATVWARYNSTHSTAALPHLQVWIFRYLFFVELALAISMMPIGTVSMVCKRFILPVIISVELHTGSIIWHQTEHSSYKDIPCIPSQIHCLFPYAWPSRAQRIDTWALADTA